ncbi:hypothetical protein [Arthrobacter celericrescens]|uniref:hypothetical protein n=1 Tax=Arthrobacter celericrescens TaxID=2320851 RepID=UPI000EA240E1|nr:hypothetical protein [Arthrobacter celericrescens]
MLDDIGFYAPLQYGTHWMWLGLLLLVLLASGLAWLFRPARTAGTARTTARARDLPSLRARYLAAIDDVVADAGSGRLPQREAHQRLSLLLRRYAGEARGIRATHMTLQELHAYGLGAIAEGVAGMYPAEFAPARPADVEQSAELARRAVRTWS